MGFGIRVNHHAESMTLLSKIVVDCGCRAPLVLMSTIKESWWEVLQYVWWEKIQQFLLYLRDLDVKKSSGMDGISAVMLKTHCLCYCTYSLKRLFNLSITSGKFPSDWKFARVVPIPKAGVRDNPANYRPISLLSSISKILERHILNVICFYLSVNSSLSTCQWGFTAKKSTTSALYTWLAKIHGWWKRCVCSFLRP